MFGQDIYLPIDTILNRVPCIFICLLGPFRLIIRGVPAMGIGEKMEVLLCTIAMQRQHIVSRELLLETLWPDKPMKQSGPLLRNLLFRLRELTDSALGGKPLIIREGTLFRLNLKADVTIDAIHFEQQVYQGNQHLNKNDTTTASEHFRQATSIYRGDLLNTHWLDAEVERERLRSLYVQSLKHLAKESLLVANAKDTLHYAFCMLASNPFNEEAHRMIMRGHMLNNQRCEAIRQFRVCRDLLKREYGIDPEPETLELYEQIRRNDGLDPIAPCPK